MPSMISLGVEYSKYDDAIAFHTVKEFVRKSLRDQAAETVVINWASFGAFSKKAYCAFNFIQQIVSQTRPSQIVPRLCFAEIRFGFRTDDNAPTHERGLRKRASTSSPEEPASGFARYSSSSRSSIAFSSAEGSEPLKSASSSISQMRSKISRLSSALSFGNSSRISLLLIAAI